MKIASRYVLKHFLPVFFVALFAFVGLYLVIDFFEKLDDLLEVQVPFLIIWSYFLYKVPFILTQGIPMAALLATIIALGILNRNRELIAMKASGMSAATYGGPILLMALILSLFDFGISEIVARPMNRRAERIWHHQVRREAPSVGWSKENVWFRGKNLIYQIRLYDQRKQILEKVSLFYLDSDFRLTQRLDARRLRWDGYQWVAEEGLILRFRGPEADQETFREINLHLDETPKDFAAIQMIPEELNWLDLYQYARKVSQEGYNSAPYGVELHTRIAFPLTTLILALLGISIALRQGLQGGIALGTGIALITAFLYLTILQIGSSLATAGILPPFLGVWAGNILFAIGGIYLWMITPQ